MKKKLVLAVGIILFIGTAGTALGHASLLLHIKSILLVLGGTLLVGFLGFPLKDCKDLFKTLYALLQERETDYPALVKHIERMSHINRVYGSVALERESKRTSNLFLQKGIDLIVDGYDPYEIHNIMEREYEVYFSRKESFVNITTTLQKLAPAIGFVGTILGLISVLSNMGNPIEMGKGMALALLTTLYGLILANFLFLPLSKKLAQQLKDESTLLYIILEGVLDISRNRNPRAVTYRLCSYLRNYRGTQEYALDFPEPIINSLKINQLQKLLARRQNA